jgi:hypothetical protein
VTEAGETSRVYELSQYSQIPLSKIHQPLRLVQAFFLEYYAVYSVAVPVGAHMWQIAGVRFHRKLCASLRTRQPQNCEDLGGDQISVAVPPLGCGHRKQKQHTLGQFDGLIS